MARALSCTNRSVVARDRSPVPRGQERCLWSGALFTVNPLFMFQLHPFAGTAAGGATVAGRRHRDGTRPATGHITHRLQSKHAT
ncbi:hypothetical protein ACLOJK_007636 [Asimina triloba]